MPRRENPLKKIYAVLNLPSGKVALKTGSRYSMYGPPRDLNIRYKWKWEK